MNYKRLVLLVLFLLLIGLTWLCADYFVADKARTFWYMLGGIWAGEVFLAVNLAVIPGADDKALPFRLGEFSVNILYLLFVFLMIIPYSNGVSAMAMLLWELGGLLVALAMFCLFGFARNDGAVAEKQHVESIASREFFRDELELMKIEKRKLLDDDKDAAQAFAKLLEEVRFASDGVAGIEEYDSRIRSKIKELGDKNTAGELVSCIDDLLALLSVRQMKLKRLR